MTTTKRNRGVTKLLAVAVLGMGVGLGATAAHADTSGTVAPAARTAASTATATTTTTTATRRVEQLVAPVTPRTLRNGRPACGNVGSRMPPRPCDTDKLATVK